MSAVALNRITIILGFIGMFIAGFLSLSHLLNVAPPCGVSHGCEIVASHKSSFLFASGDSKGIPVAYLGVLGYLVLTALAVIRGVSGKPASRPLVMTGFVLSALGAAYSGYLTYIALYEIGATCIWCISSAITMVLTTLVYAAMLQTEQPTDLPDKTKYADSIVAVGLLLATMISLGAGGILLKSGGSKISPDAITNISDGKIHLVDKDSHILGQADAPITVVEFADLLCPACRSAYPQVEEIVRDSGGKVRAVFRHFPLFMKEDHKMAMPAATIAEIAGEEGKFWNYLSAIYSKQSEDLQTPDSILELAQGIGLDVEKVRKRLQDPEDPAVKRVTNDFNLANELKIEQTPTMFLLAPGVEPRTVLIGDLKAILSQEPYAKLMKGGATSAAK